MHSPDSPATGNNSPVAFREAFLFWLKLGFISFGGPAGQIAIMHQELVEKRQWISERRFLHALNYCMLLPGPEAQQLAIYLGWLLHRTWGGIIAGSLFILPSLLILILLSWLYLAFGDTQLLAGLFYGLKPAVTAIVLHAAHRIGTRVLINPMLWLLAIAAFLSMLLLDMSFPLIIVSAALLAHLASRLAPDKFTRSDHDATPIIASIVDDDYRPAHTRFHWPKLVTIVMTGILLWLIPMAVLNYQYGWNHALTQMAWFFSKAALMTFGGAYAVLPYVYQGAVEHYHWLLPQQMIDGLALGETTPGPLIMVVTFVGFVAGWTQNLFGPEHLLLSGVIAALVVTYFSFLPSFLFILAGGPLVESSRNNLKLTAPLTGITAAVVGVILNLAIFFAQHVFWPHGLNGQTDISAVLICLLALLALFRYRLNVMVVMAGCGVAGLLLSFWGMQ
jgi:chromate transporter